jgi:hypothetical protein
MSRDARKKELNCFGLASCWTAEEMWFDSEPFQVEARDFSLLHSVETGCVGLLSAANTSSESKVVRA